VASFALVILVRNQALGLVQTLRALDNTDFDEILILDDASSDEISSLVQEVCQQINLPNLKIFKSEENIGTFENLKRGFELANSDFVTTMAAEDKLVNDFVKKLQNYIGHKDQKIVYVPSIQRNSLNQILGISTPQFAQNFFRDFLRLRERNLSHGGGATYPRLKVLQSNISHVSTFNLVEDWLIFYLLAESGFRFRTIPDVMYIHEVDLSKTANLDRFQRHQRFELDIRRIILARKLRIRLRLLVSLQKIFHRIKIIRYSITNRRPSLKQDRGRKS